MDQVRAILRALWQQRFWILSVVGVIVAVVCWKMGAAALDAKFTANKSTIEGKFSDMTAIVGKTPHGNDEVNSQEFKQASVIKENVLNLWQQLYDRQHKAVLKWPPVLGENFLNKIKNRQFGDKAIDADMRNLYWNYIKKRFNGLLKIVDAQKMRGDQAGGAYGGEYSGRGGYGGEGMGGAPVVQEDDYLVQWVDQGALRAKLEFDRQPTPMQIWVTQEDLWVYETLLDVIADTNRDREATRPDNTAVRMIMNLEVGRDAAMANMTPGSVLIPGGDPAAAAGGEALATREMPSSEGGGYGSGAGMEGADPDAEALAFRYIGEDGKPAATTDPTASGEFRKLPIRMVLIMDQRWIPTLLVHLANAHLPVQVERVRINGSKSGVGFDAAMASASTGEGGMGGYGRGGAGSYGPGAGGYGRGGGSYEGSFGANVTMPTGPGTAELAEVEIQGVVCIFNAPKKDALTIPGGDAAPQDVASTATPVAR